MIIKILIVIICYFSKFSNTFFEKRPSVNFKILLFIHK